MTAKDKEALELRAQIQQHLVESGNYERISNKLAQRLLDEGWIDQVKKLTRETMEDDNTTNFSEVLKRVEPEAVSLVSANTKNEIMQQIKAFLCDILDTQ
ncbi:ADL343Cp [Eremothecium gossypii ATCC 10895]|uniref:Transcription and mRNA export factor SUS1 n=1 Tax=Eremothecium gossypii (strain ATCC 10895 / CBS 109.51 / FGSC 9923 / NRRL Y-1056) TaxID=284811 RepID=SUS1_EREGS|nr:ADL343Cp [Eremothecium gossypii ATCC 10895]Q75BB0.1 RecName: Full=Transcription and mRNA export factor SUS1 [Eremothecium gossypii ATCC 10895]AAS51576.1 ADL343Cp [Eremothecium gossypii ATCC 10895]AEY95873.1 FADL343Cp [Eremothecium gossypii FDAG1]